MKSYHTLQDISLSPAGHHRSKWTAIIPAAGKGSRLNYHLPKILYPVGGKPILNWLVELLQPLCAKLVFVVSPEGFDSIQQALKEILPEEQFSLAIQEVPRGMADAVACAENFVNTPNALVVWGDQITLSATTLQAGIELHEQKQTHLTLPTVMVSQPYIHFDRNGTGQIQYVYQKREEPMPVAEGESDCGLFFFRTQSLFQILNQHREDPKAYGKSTQEYNLLQLIPLFAQMDRPLETLRMLDTSETLGINTPEDALKAQKILESRRSSHGRQ